MKNVDIDDIWFDDYGGWDGDIMGAVGLMCDKYETNLTIRRNRFVRIMSGGTRRPGSGRSMATKGRTRWHGAVPQPFRIDMIRLGKVRLN